MADRTEAAQGLEARLARLEAIVAALEHDDLELEEALRIFEEGIGHLRAVRQVLREGELRIDRLLEGEDGPIVKAMGPEEG